MQTAHAHIKEHVFVFIQIQPSRREIFLCIFHLFFHILMHIDISIKMPFDQNNIHRENHLSSVRVALSPGPTVAGKRTPA